MLENEGKAMFSLLILRLSPFPCSIDIPANLNI